MQSSLGSSIDINIVINLRYLEVAVYYINISVLFYLTYILIYDN